MSRILPLLFLVAFAHQQLLAAPEAFETHAGNADQLPNGREADAIIGDFILRNDVIEAVIAGNQPLRRPNMSTFYGEGQETPGGLYDLTLRGQHNDQLTVWTPNNQRGPLSWVKIHSSGADGEAAIEVFTSAAKGGGISRRHVYATRDGIYGVFCISILKNESSEAKEIALADAWTNFLSKGELGRYHWADSVDPDDKCGYSYAWLSPNEAETGAKTTLEPGSSITITRFIAVGTSPAEAIGRVADQLGESKPLESRFVQAGGDSGIPDAVLMIQVDDRQRIPVYPGDDGAFSIPFVAGEFPAFAVAPGRPKVELTVNAGGAAKTIEMAKASSIAFEVTDGDGVSIPCKAQIHGINGTAQPNLGPTIRAHGCVDQWHSETGSFNVKVPAGAYRVVLTRGPEYGHHEQEITVAPGESTAVTANLVRQVDTAGWISADFHNHSTPSGDNVCGTDDRVINLAVEHFEFAPTTEHNRIYDWTPHIEKLGLTKFITTVPGIELTGPGAHINCFPLKPVPRTQDGGAPVWVKDPRINIAALQNLGGHDPNRWTQINHPDLSENFLDRNKDKQLDGGFVLLDGLVDGVETQNYRDSNILLGVPFVLSDPLSKGSRITQIREFIWLQLLNQGAKLWAVGVADAHHVYGNGVGSWRCYLPSTTDEPAEIDWRATVEHARKGHMILSSGPYLEIAAPGGALPGDTIEAKDKKVELGIRVQCADWFDIDRVQILVNGAQDPRLNFTREANPDMFSDETVRFDQKIAIDLERDAHLIVVAHGANSTLAKGFGTSAQASIHPCAYNNPIFVDVDGNGFQPNGDTLGYSLPTGGLSVDEVKKILDQD